MGHEVVVFGAIQAIGDESAHEHNRRVLSLLPAPGEDEWPWLNRQMFAATDDYPHGQYVTLITHFGLSFKDAYPDLVSPRPHEAWLTKFVELLRKLYWLSAIVIIQTEFEVTRATELVNKSFDQLGSEGTSAFVDLRRLDYPSDELERERLDRIVSNLDVLQGQPCIRGQRVPVSRVLEAVATYPDRDELRNEYPELSDEDIRQALIFAARQL